VLSKNEVLFAGSNCGQDSQAWRNERFLTKIDYQAFCSDQ
jgi:hypothetical protein